MAKLDKQDQRIATIFGTQEVPEVDTDTLERYLDHLKQHLALPCQLTGIEDFGDRLKTGPEACWQVDTFSGHLTGAQTP